MPSRQSTTFKVSPNFWCEKCRTEWTYPMILQPFKPAQEETVERALIKSLDAANVSTVTPNGWNSNSSRSAVNINVSVVAVVQYYQLCCINYITLLLLGTSFVTC